MVIKDLRVEIRPHIGEAEVHARRSVLSKNLSGNWTTAFKGRGIEFAGYRSYQYGDDAALIDWRASLRGNALLVREFEEHRAFSVFLLLDVSNSMLFSSTNKLKAEYAAEMTYALADGILRSGDAVGLGMFTDQLVTSVYPNFGKGMLDRFSEELKNPLHYGGGFDLKKVLMQTRSFLKTNAVIIIISDFIGLEEGWGRYIQRMSHNFEMLGIMVKDRRDRTIPKGVGQYHLRDPYTQESLYVDLDDYAKAYEALVVEEERKIVRVFEHVKGGVIHVTTEKDFVDPLTRFFNKRQFITAVS